MVVKEMETVGAQADSAIRIISCDQFGLPRMPPA